MIIREFSFGIIPVKKFHLGWKVLLIQHHSGFWSFPKGHAEKGESPKEAAERELFEETHLKVSRYWAEEPIQENYFFQLNGNKISKSVDFFIATVKGRLKIQEGEVKASQWIEFADAFTILSFPESKRVLKEALMKLIDLS